MKSLYDLMCEKLNAIEHEKEFTKLEDFITKDERSQRFIDSLTGSTEYSDIKIRMLYSVAETRARHSSITFLMGLIFWDFCNIGKKIGELFTSNKENNAYRVWLMTALNHDMAYSSAYLKQGTLSFHDITKYYLLDDSSLLEFMNYEKKHSDVLRYWYREIEGYDDWARNFHKLRGDLEERIDHGILGGVLTFDRMMRRTIQDGSGQGYIIKPASLTIAQHNMFKSDSKQFDMQYPGKPKVLQFGSKVVINFRTPLLLLLSIVDTVECVKKFCRSNLGPKKQIETLNVLKNIDIDVGRTEIHIDYSRYLKEVDKTNNRDLFNRYYASVCSLSTWTSLHVDNNRGQEITIS